MKINLYCLLAIIYIALSSTAQAGSTLSAGIDHVCAIKTDKTLVCWGDNTYNQIDPPVGTFVQVSAGFNFSCGLDTKGKLNCWGQDTAGETSPPSGYFTQVEAGGTHACALDKNGEPICWGENADGQSAYLPGPFKQLALGDAHSCGLHQDGSVECWGNNSHNQSNLINEPFVYITAGYKTTCGIKADGAANCWGRTTNTFGFLTLIYFGNYGAIADRDSGEHILCGLKPNKTLICPSLKSVPSGVFTYVAVGGHVTRYDVSYSVGDDYHFNSFGCGIRENGLVSCWGENRKGRATAPVGVKILQTAGTVNLPTNSGGGGGFTQADIDKAIAKAKQECKTNPTNCGIINNDNTCQVNGEAVATINADLSLHFDKAKYETLTGISYLWADFTFDGKNKDDKMIWYLDKYGIVE